MLFSVLGLLTDAQQYTGVARAQLEDAVGILSELGDQHSEPCPPPELLRALERLKDGREVIATGIRRVGDIGARL